MDKVRLSDIKLIKLKKISTRGGDVMKVMTKNDTSFKKYGEAYFSWIKYQSIKGWKIHRKMTLNLVVPIGKVKFVFCLPDKYSTFRVIEIGESNKFYKRITVPPNICFAFTGISKQKSLILNIADIVHSKKEADKITLNSIPYKW